MLYTSGKTGSLLTDLYRAAADSSLWPNWVESLAGQHRADHAVIFSRETFSCETQGDAWLSAVFNISQEQNQVYRAYFAEKDEWLRAVNRSCGLDGLALASNCARNKGWSGRSSTSHEF